MTTRKFLSKLIPALPMLLTALLVILVTVIFLTAMRSKAHAQFGGVEQPMFQLASVAATSITNDPATAFYWNFNDLSDGVVTSWADRVQAKTFLRHYPSVGPTKGADGPVFLYNDTFDYYVLTNSHLPSMSNAVLGLIFKPVKMQFMFSCFVGWTNSNWSFYADSETASDRGGFFDALTSSYLSSRFYYTNRLLWMVVHSNLVRKYFTNNVLSTAPATTYDSLPNIKSIGGQIQGTPYNNYQGTIQELIIWTNISDATPFLSNYWYYATNTYTGWKEP